MTQRRHPAFKTLLTTDGFKVIGEGMLLCFEREWKGKIQRDFILCKTAKEARATIQREKLTGWTLRYRMFGEVAT